jgi:hypothetical protein
MEPTPDTPQAAFELRRCIINSKFRKYRDTSSSTDFRYGLNLPVNSQIFRFAVRRISFPFVCPPYDTSAFYAPKVICAIKFYLPTNTLSSNTNTREFILDARYDDLTSLAAALQSKLRSMLTYTFAEATALGWQGSDALDANGAQNISDTNKMVVSLSGNVLTFTSQKFAVSFSSPPQSSSNANGLAILGFPRLGTFMPQTSPSFSVSSTFVPNLSGSNGSFYLTSNALQAAARSTKPVVGPFQNVIASFYPNGQNLTEINVLFTEPTIYSTAQGNRLDDFDLQLRYETGTPLDLGANEIEVELEMEIMDLTNTSAVRMREAIGLPVIRPYETQKVFQSTFSSGSVARGY